MLAIAHPLMLPSAMRNDVGTLVAIISQLNGLPACAPVNASMIALRLATHDSGPGWFATPFPYDSFIHNSTPVYPGALRSLLVQFGISAPAARQDAVVLVNRIVDRQAQIMAYNDANWACVVLVLAVAPLVLLLPRRAPLGETGGEAH